MWAARTLPKDLFCAGIVRALANLYWMTARHRRKIVIEMSPPSGGDRQAALQKRGDGSLTNSPSSSWTFGSMKQACQLMGCLAPPRGGEFFEKARAEKRGILLADPHLGNWEFGAHC